MTESEISEIRTAIATIHGLTDNDPLEGWKYMMLKAVLPLLEKAASWEERVPKYWPLTSSEYLIWEQALEISKVVNYKRPNTTTICDLEVKEDRARPTGGYLGRTGDLQELGLLPKKGVTMSKSTLKRLQAEGRIQEKK